MTIRAYLRSYFWVTGLAIAASCGPGPEKINRSKSADSIDPQDNPARVIPNATARLWDNITPDDINKTIGVDDAHVPYPDTYWPFNQGGVDARWNGDDDTPLEKFVKLTNPDALEAAKAWEASHHGPNVPNVEDWWGHCPGWTGAASSNPAIKHAVAVEFDGHNLRPCDVPIGQGCFRFEIGDINALEAEIYVDADAAFAGARCDTPPNQIRRDIAGRIVRDGSGCKGINAGALMVLLGNRMKRDQKALAIDAQNDFNTDQIWNQPAYRYTVYEYVALSVSEAANLVAYGQAWGPLDWYPWNWDAVGFVGIDIGIEWVSELGPNMDPVPGTRSTRETRFVAVLELDSYPNDPAAVIIGGEYLDDPSVGADRLSVPPFVWIAKGPGPEDLDGDVDGRHHNPFVKPSVVEQLIALGSR
jgi:hypothetical protein